MVVVWSWSRLLGLWPSSPTTHAHQGQGSPDEVVLGFPQRFMLTPTEPFFFFGPACIPLLLLASQAWQGWVVPGQGREGTVLS